MANKNKAAADVVLEVNINQYNKEKSSVSTRSRGVIVGKETFDYAVDMSDFIINKATELAESNELEINEIPVIIEGTGTNEALKDILKDKGLNVVQRSKAKKDKDYYGYSDDYYDYYYSPLTPYGVINFDQLDEAQAAKDLTNDYLVLFAQMAEMGQRIINGEYYLEFGDERGKLSLMTELVNQFLTKLEKVTAEHNVYVRKEVNLNPATEEEAVETVKEIIEEAVETFVAENQPENVTKEAAELVVDSKGVMLFKSASGELIWAGIHTNKFQDRDRDILKEASHKKFLQKVYDGEYPFPKLQIWHIDKDVGEANWMAYDERGFLLSGGVVYPEFEELVTNLVKNTPEMGMSHGMPYETVVYDGEGYIDEYQSIEVTMLPISEAANILTGFTVEKK
jgi:hypothetical protein